jgi:hypothetical protein
MPRFLELTSTSQVSITESETQSQYWLCIQKKRGCFAVSLKEWILTQSCLFNFIKLTPITVFKFRIFLFPFLIIIEMICMIKFPLLPSLTTIQCSASLLININNLLTNYHLIRIQW